MPGALIVADQPTGAGAGSPGVARSDLWSGRAVQLSVGVGGNTSYAWELLASPPGSAAAVSTPSASTSAFTPDAVGSYRVRLTTNAGGPGNVQTLVFRVSRDSSGVVVSRGHVLPAYGEKGSEGGSVRGYAPLFEYIFGDILSFITGFTTNALKTDGSNNAHINVASIVNESNAKCVITTKSGNLATTTAGTSDIVLGAVGSAAVSAFDTFVTVRNSTGSVRGRWRLSALTYNTGGSAALEGAVDVDAGARKSDPALDATIVVSGTNVILRVTATATNLQWGYEVRRQDQVF